MQTQWYTKYQQRDEFLSWFTTEQEYIDAMFALMIMYNFGIWLDPEDML